jgi:hypothetical protein
MPPCRPIVRHSARFWVLLIGATIFQCLEPGLFLVVLALGLSALALVWIVLLAGMLLRDAFEAVVPRGSRPDAVDDPAAH